MVSSTRDLLQFTSADRDGHRSVRRESNCESSRSFEREPATAASGNEQPHTKDK